MGPQVETGSRGNNVGGILCIRDEARRHWTLFGERTGEWVGYVGVSNVQTD